MKVGNDSLFTSHLFTTKNERNLENMEINSVKKGDKFVIEVESIDYDNYDEPMVKIKDTNRTMFLTEFEKLEKADSHIYTLTRKCEQYAKMYSDLRSKMDLDKEMK